MKLFFPEELERYADAHTTRPTEFLEELERETKKCVPMSQMLTGRVEGTLLRMLVRISGAKKVVDVGTYTGYSALMMAEGLPPDGEIITCEISEDHAELALRFIARSPRANQIRLRLGHAIDTLREIPSSSADFVFIDADKLSYADYYAESLRILRHGGLIAVDNVFWSGRVLDPKDEDSRAIAEFNEVVKNDERVEKVMLSIRDGVYLIRKL
jgi:caffeoyl-CoA O-methyltransferase